MLAEPDFRKLFATRLISQTGDGVFNAGLAAYVFFSAQIFPDPLAAAEAFAVLYLPYSLAGPFAGVFIDRWQRRQILVWSAVIRAGFVAVAAFFIASGTLGLPLYLAALAVLGVNRFFLSALSAALPRVVADDKLVMANSVAPTSGTIVAFAGGLIGLGVHRLTGGGPGGSAAVMAAAGACYLVAGLAALRMARGLLGPDAGTAGRGRLRRELRAVLDGLVAGVRHVAARRQAAAALLATGSHRFLYGILLLMSILLYRNYFYPGSGGSAALSHFSLLVITSAAGYGLAAAGHAGGHPAAAEAGLDRCPAGRRRGVHRGAGRDLPAGAVPGHRVRAGPGRAGRGHLHLDDPAAAGGRRLPRPGVLHQRHALQRRVRARGGGLRAVHAGQRVLLPDAHRGGRGLRSWPRAATCC